MYMCFVEDNNSRKKRKKEKRKKINKYRIRSESKRVTENPRKEVESNIY